MMPTKCDTRRSHAGPRRRITAKSIRWARSAAARSRSACYIDALTICMFCMVTLIASCIHFYSIGYMHDELAGDDYVDHEVTLPDGSHLHRPGRYHRFFQFLSLFCFSMLGLVLAGNIAMTFVFWELVGHLLLLPDRLLHRTTQRLDRRQQGVHRQPHRRLRHDHRPDGHLGQPGHVCVRRGAGDLQQVRPAQ